MDSKGKGRRSRSRSPHSTKSGSSSSHSPSRKRAGNKGTGETENGDSHMETRGKMKGVSKDTNSSDPKSVRCRVFVGNLGNVPKEDIIEHFQQYGEVVGVSIHANFGFVQYNNVEDADLAVGKTDGTTIFGKRVDCNIASERRKPQTKDADGPGYNRGKRARSRSPRDRDRYPRDPSPRSRYDELLRRDYGRIDDLDYDCPRFASPHPDDMYRRYPDDDLHWPPYRDNVRRLGTDPYARHPPLPPPRPPNDCEIVLASKETSGYGELIESRLRSIGVLSAVRFPEPDVPLNEILEQVSARGALYSILITETNELHRSCTLNILHGTPQEHRNMPLEDALALVARNFESYLRALKERGPFGSQLQQDPGFKTSLVQDAEIASLLKLAAGGRILTVGEIDKLIDALRKYKSEIEAKNNQSTGNVSDVREFKNSTDNVPVGYTYNDSRGVGGGQSYPPFVPTTSADIGYPRGYGDSYPIPKGQAYPTSVASATGLSISTATLPLV